MLCRWKRMCSYLHPQPAHFAVMAHSERWQEDMGIFDCFACFQVCNGANRRHAVARNSLCGRAVHRDDADQRPGGIDRRHRSPGPA